MGNSSYTVEYFVLDPDFRNWILHPDFESNLRWEKFLEENSACRKDVLLARRIVLYLEQRQVQADKLAGEEEADIWNKIKEGVAKKDGTGRKGALVVPISSEVVLNRQKEEKKEWPAYLKYAAVILVAIGLGLLWTLSGQKQVQETTIVADYWQNYETPLGVKSTITLSDGSIVTLNSGSRIRYVENFTGPRREVFLEGEAFFEVAKDSLKPFIVHTEDLSTQALGTSFNIKAFRGKLIEISLVTGLVEVKVQNGKNKELITPGEGIISMPGGEDWKRQKVNLEHITAWMNKTIVFEDTPFLTAVHTLENWYGVRIHLLNFKDESLKVSGKYKDETLKNILDGLGYGVRFDYRIKGMEVTIEFE
jgi:transmembrane sensor